MPKPSKGSPVLKSKWLELEDFEFLCFDLAKQLMSYGEPIPDYASRDNGLLAAALGAPKQTFDQNLLYPTLSKQASILFYSLIKNHPFRNGNKRVGVMALLAFLGLNGKWINIEPINLYKIAYIVSESEPTDRYKILETVENLITKNLINFPNP